MGKKISQLNEATALQGPELIAVVQSAETKSASINDIKKYQVAQSLTVTGGETVDLNNSTYDDLELLKLSWSGGAGTMTLTLPDATESKNLNRMIRIISDSTFATNTHADLTPAAGQNLDGSTNYYRINKEYEGIKVWSDGSEWFIIQKKA